MWCDSSRSLPRWKISSSRWQARKASWPSAKPRPPLLGNWGETIAGRPKKLNLMDSHDELAPIIVPEAEAREIRRLVWPLFRSNPARRAADALVNGVPPGPASANELVRKLKGFGALRWRECAVASWALGYARPDSADRSSVVALPSTLGNSRPPP